MSGKRIGILTFWGVPNYGAWAQAYALNNLVKSIVSDENNVEHINYLHPKHFSIYYEKDERLYNSFSYSWNIIPHTPKYNADELESQKFDIIITGSDAIWAFDIKNFGDDIHLIGNNLNTDKLVAYAPSFGNIGMLEQYDSWIIDGLKKYDNIAVRDKNSKNIVKHLTSNMDPDIVLDPTLVWNFEQDINVVSPTYKNYIAVYGHIWDSYFIEKTVKFAKEKGLKLISIGYMNDWCDMSLKMIELRTLEWLGMIKNASYVVTSTFHGLMLGLSFHKQVKFYQGQHVKYRSQTLKEELKLPDHTNEYSDEFDYEYIDKKLESLREKSITYLKNILGEN